MRLALQGRAVRRWSWLSSWPVSHGSEFHWVNSELVVNPKMVVNPELVVHPGVVTLLQYKSQTICADLTPLETVAT